jgi:hypothetical protein
MPAKGVLKAVAITTVSFAGLVGMTVILWANKIISPEMAILMLVALLGLYVGFGVLITVYRFLEKLE